jgi:hypothetical protein
MNALNNYLELLRIGAYAGIVACLLGGINCPRRLKTDRLSTAES